MNLYEINTLLEAEIDRIFSSVDENGEITESLDTLDCIKLAREDKLENLALYIKNIRSDVAKFKAEEENLKNRRVSLENKAKRLETYLQSNFNYEEKLETPRVKLSYRHSYKVSISDEAIIPKKYFRVKSEVDKVAIKHAIDEGKKVKGAEIVENYSLQIK